MVAHHTPARVDTRDEWAQLAGRLVRRARDFGSAGHARIDFPGQDSAYGHDVGGLEGFARTFLLAALLIASRDGDDPDDVLGWYAAGLVAGTDPHSPERWTSMHDHGQPKVEAASLALGLHLTRPWLWDQLTDPQRAHVVRYLEEWVGNDYPPCNWVWFRIITEQFLLGVGSARAGEIARDLDTDLAYVETLYRGDGWYSDGDERSYDYYAGWAMQVYPTLWLQMAGPDDRRAARWRDVFRQRLSRYIEDYVHLIGGDGAPLFQGRSLTYRFAVAAPLWAAAIAGIGDPGQLRAAASRVVSFFLGHGVLAHDDILDLGWLGPWRRIAQHYSGPGSPYWAAKGFLGLALPKTHPVWTAPAVPLPVDTADSLRLIAAPGWVVSATHADGIVRVINAGTDHSRAGVFRADDPLYARLGYSTVTAPVFDTDSPQGPSDNTIALLDDTGAASYRTGFELSGVMTIRPGVGIGGWRGTAHWSSGGSAELEVLIVVRGSHELRFARTSGRHRLRFAGWPLTDAQPPAQTTTQDAAVTMTATLRSTVQALTATPTAAAVRLYDDATPLGPVTAVPHVDLTSSGGHSAWRGVYVQLTGTASPPPAPVVTVRGATTHLHWTDGQHDELRLDELAERLFTRPVPTTELP